VRSATNRLICLARGIVKDGNVQGAVDTLSQIRVYPLKQAAHPPQTKIVRSSGKGLSSIPPSGYAYWERLADIISSETVEPRDRFFYAMLKPLGIEKGKPFAPDARQKQILSDAATLGFRMSQALSVVWADRGLLRQELEARGHRAGRLGREASTSIQRRVPSLAL